MNIIKWKFMSKYKKLLYTLEICKVNKQTFHIENGIVLDFDKMEIRIEKEN